MKVAQSLRHAVDTRDGQEALIFGEVRLLTRFACSQSGKGQKFKLRARAPQEEMEGREPK
jgi:hypothetical protein